MNRLSDSQLSDLILTPYMKEYAFKTSIVSEFQYSAGLVPWLLNERLEINNMWSSMSQYTRFWWRRKSAHGINASPILLSITNGGWDCPTAIEEWTREVLTLYNQCLLLPGESVWTLWRCGFGDGSSKLGPCQLFCRSSPDVPNRQPKNFQPRAARL